MVLSFIKRVIEKGAGMIMTSIKKTILSLPKDVVNVFDLGYLGVEEKDFPQQLSYIPNRKKINLGLSQEEIELTKVIPKKE